MIHLRVMPDRSLELAGAATLGAASGIGLVGGIQFLTPDRPFAALAIASAAMLFCIGITFIIWSRR